MPQAVATSTGRRLFDLKTQRHGAWFAVFAKVILGDDPRILHGKPAPDIFLLAADDLRVAPANCVVLEDAPSGVAAARAAGMQVIAVPYPGMDPAKLAAADLVVGSLCDLDPATLGTGR